MVHRLHTEHALGVTWLNSDAERDELKGVIIDVGCKFQALMTMT